MDTSEYRNILESVYPRTIWPLLVKMARDTYASVAKLKKQDLFWLDGVHGRQAVGVLRSVLMEFNIKTLIDGIPGNFYRTEYVPNTTKSHHHIEVYTKDTITTVCKVNLSNKLPSRAADYRRRLSASNQPSLELFPGDITPKSFLEEDNRIYVPITHSRNIADHDALGSLCIGIPDRDLKLWLHKINLTEEIKVLAGDVPSKQLVDTEKIAEESIMKWKTGKLKDAVNFDDRDGNE